MVCYVVPTIAAVVHGVMRKNVDSLKKNTYQLWLNLMLAGAGIFGFIDHLWNGELTLIGPNLANDLLLGATITLVTVALWAVLVTVDKHQHKQTIKT
jgi:hypothetical protein